MLDPERQTLIDDLEQAVEALREKSHHIEQLEKSWHESEWYLGETRARNQRLEDELRDKDHYIRKIEADCSDLKQQLDQARACLDELKSRCRRPEAPMEHL